MTRRLMFIGGRVSHHVRDTRIRGRRNTNSGNDGGGANHRTAQNNPPELEAD
ncbi:hypothetical protein BH11VER1_BH11VER1_01390 [soil metagenome]